MTDALEDLTKKQNKLPTFLFVNYTDGLAGKEEELAFLVDRLDKTSAAFSMEISAEKTKLMTNNANGISVDIKINGEKFDEVKSCKYLGAVVTDQESKPEILSRIAQKTAALVRLKTIWNNKHTSLSSKIRLMHSLVISVLSVVRLQSATDIGTLSLQLILFSTSLWVLQNFNPLHSEILFSQRFFRRPLLLPPCTVRCKIVLTSPADLDTCPNHLNLRFFTEVKISS